MSEVILKEDKSKKIENVQKNDGKEEEKNILIIEEENDNDELENIWKLLIDE
jgi:hypothetical protein